MNKETDVIKEWIARKIVNRAESTESDVTLWDALQKPTDPENFNDSFYFTGHDFNGSFVITRLGFRSSGHTELWFDCNFSESGRVSFKVKNESRGEGISYGPLEYICLEPTKKWKIVFQGKADVSGTEKDVSFEAVFDAVSRVIDFKKDADHLSLARYLAKEKWSLKWFRKLKDLSQVHTEQAGRLKGFIEYDNKKETFDLMSVRDHSFGTRDWKAMIRHLWVTVLFEDDSSLNISLVSYEFISFLHSGYYIKGDDVMAVTDSDDFGVVPSGDPRGKSFTLNFSLGNEKKSIICNVNDVVDYTMMKSYKMYEGIASFTLDGKRGVGICEIGTRV